MEIQTSLKAALNIREFVKHMLYATATRTSFEIALLWLIRQWTPSYSCVTYVDVVYNVFLELAINFSFELDNSLRGQV